MAKLNLLLRMLNLGGVTINPATEDKQDSGNTSLSQIKAKTDNLDLTLTALRDALKGGKSLADIWTSLQLQKELAESIWTDNTNGYFVRRVVTDEIAGTFTVSWTDADGNASVGPGTGKRPLSSPDREAVQSLFTATAGGTGYSTSDILARCLIIDTSVVPPTILATLWFNIALGTAIGAPAGGTYRQDLGLTLQELQAEALAKDGTDGTSPPPVLGGGTGIRGWLRSIYEKLTGSIAVTGTFWQATQPVSGTVAVSNMIPAVETGLAKDGTDGTSPPPVLGGGTGIRGWLRSIYEKLTGSIAVTGTFWLETQPVVGPLTDTQLRAVDVKTRDRAEDTVHLAHAQGTASVANAAWGTLASITVPTGKKYRLLMAEGDYDDLGSIANARGIRIRQANTVKATALTGANQPNPDIEGLTLENTSGGNETWDIQGRNGDSVAAHTMYGWFSWVEVSD